MSKTQLKDGERREPQLPGYRTEPVLARLIGRSEKSMWRLRISGKGPVPTIIGRRIFYSDADVAAWLEKCREEKPARRRAVGKTARRAVRGQEGRAA